MELSQVDVSKKLIDDIKGVVGNIDFTKDIGEYIFDVDRKIRHIILKSGINDAKQLESDYISFRRQMMRALRNGDINSFSDISSFLVPFGASQSPESLEKQEVLVRELDTNFWEGITVEAPPEGVIYRGGTARRILREYLGLPPKEADKNTDIDVFVGPDNNIDEVRNYFSCDSEGITQLIDTSYETLQEKCKHVDMGMNQILVSGDRIYYTKKAEEAMRTGISEVLEEPDNLFGVKQYKDSLGRVIFTNQKLYRVLSMLVRGKLDRVNIRRDNISFENADAIGGMQKYLVIVLKKILSEAGDDRESLKIMLYRYADLLMQMGYIENHENIFTLLGGTHRDGPVKVYDSYLQKDFDDNGKRDMLWRLDKITRVLVRKIIPDQLQDFKYDPANEIIQLGVDYSGLKDFDGEFETHWDSFNNLIRYQDEQK